MRDCPLTRVLVLSFLLVPLLCTGCPPEPKSTIVSVRGDVEGARSSRSLTMNYNAQDGPAPHVVKNENTNVAYLSRVAVKADLLQGMAPAERCMFLTFLLPSIRTDHCAGDAEWLTSHCGDIVSVLHWWFDPRNTYPEEILPSFRASSAAYLIRIENNDACIPWRDPTQDLDMQRLSEQVFVALSSALADGLKNVSDVTLSGTERDGEPKLYFVPKAGESLLPRDNHGRTYGKGFTYIYEASIDGPYSIKLKAYIPLSILFFATRQGVSPGDVEASYAADGSRCLYEVFIRPHPEKVVVHAQTPLDLFPAQVAEIVQTKIADAFSDLSQETLDKIHEAEILLSIGVYLYRGDLAPGFDVVLVPRRLSIRSSQVWPEMTEVELYFLE